MRLLLLPIWLIFFIVVKINFDLIVAMMPLDLLLIEDTWMNITYFFKISKLVKYPNSQQIQLNKQYLIFMMNVFIRMKM